MMFKNKYKIFNIVNKKNIKIKYIFLIFLMMLCLINVCQNWDFLNVQAANSKEEVEENLKDSVENQLGSVDFDKLDNVLDEIENEFLDHSVGFKDIVKQILNGNYYNDFGSLFKSIISILFKNVLRFIPILLVVIAISLLTQLLLNFKGERFDSGIVNVINMVSIIVVIVLLVAVFKEIFQMTSSTINLMERQIEVIFPILLTFLSSMGSVVSVGIYKPIVGVLSTTVSFIFSNFVYPIFIFAFVLIILNRMSNSFKLDKMFNFVNSLFKWVVGFVFTIFGAFLTIQGISAGKYDQISFKTTRFAIKSYVPIVGGYLGDGLDLVVLSSVLIKNSVGLAGIFVLIITIISPIITIIVLKLLLQLVSSIVDILGDNKVASFLDDCSKVLIYPVVIILCVSFMYLISIGLIVCTSNII